MKNIWVSFVFWLIGRLQQTAGCICHQLYLSQANCQLCVTGNPSSVSVASKLTGKPTCSSASQAACWPACQLCRRPYGTYNWQPKFLNMLDLAPYATQESQKLQAISESEIKRIQSRKEIASLPIHLPPDPKFLDSGQRSQSLHFAIQNLNRKLTFGASGCQDQISGFWPGIPKRSFCRARPYSKA